MKIRLINCMVAAALVICTSSGVSGRSNDHETYTIIDLGTLGASWSTPSAMNLLTPPVQQTVAFTVKPEAFAEGGQGCWQGPVYCGGGYYDETPGNWGDAQVRPGTDVDLWYDDGGIVIGGLDGLEWVTFPVHVPQSGHYRVRFRTASPADRPSGSGLVNVGIHGVDGSWIGNQTVPITGGAGEWHRYVTWQAPTTIYLPAGAQILTMWAAGGWYNVRNMTFTREPPLTSTGDIVFVSTRDGNPEIYSVKADGANLTRLTNNPANDDAPVWSPDRKRIAFASDRDGSPEIYVMNADGTNVVRRTFSASYSGDPCWSADGNRIVYSTLSNGSLNIWTVSPDSGSPALLLENPGYDAHPALSPDGSRLAVTSDWYAYDSVYDVFIANADGTGWTGLTGDFFDHADYVRPSWSPDSAKLAVAITETTGVDQYITQLGVMNADGSGLTPLIGAAPWAKSSWAPDGTTIAFTSGSPGALNISWVSTDGSKSGTIVTNGYSPDWAMPTTTVRFTVAAETFAGGGQGCWQGPFYCGGGHYDQTPGNWGDAQVRPGTNVDLWYDDGGIVIGGLDGLEWVTFPVNVPQSGRYQVTFRTASPADRPGGSGAINVGIHGVAGSWLGNQIVPVTGGPGEWHRYVTWKAPGTIYLPAGPQTLTMWAAGGWYNVRNITFTLEGAAPR